MCFAGFLAIFASDVFGEHLGTGELMLALFMHLLPTFLVLAVLAMAWTHEWIGSAAFLMLAVVYAWWALPKHWDWVVFIAGPMVLIALLFWMSWTARRHARLAH